MAADYSNHRNQFLVVVVGYDSMLPIERKIPKVTELEPIHATAEQQKEMEKLLKKITRNKEYCSKYSNVGLMSMFYSWRLS